MSAPTDAAHRQFYQSDDLQRFGREQMPEQFTATQEWLRRLGVGADARVLELGAGRGPLAGVHRRYIGLEFSLPALRAFAPGAVRINADMQVLPFRGGSIDCIFSWAAIEHVPRPEEVLAEVCRVLRPGGVALLAPAWNCRPWAAKGLPIKRYRELGWADRARKASIPLRDHLLWRAAWAAPGRLWREWKAQSGRPLPFDYQRLEPNLREYVYTDCDAFTSMDPHAAILFFETRGWEVISHPNRRARLLSRHEPVVVRKP
jgi:SAM-dependent methyltransferase